MVTHPGTDGSRPVRLAQPREAGNGLLVSSLGDVAEKVLRAPIGDFKMAKGLWFIGKGELLSSAP